MTTSESKAESKAESASLSGFDKSATNFTNVNIHDDI